LIYLPSLGQAAGVTTVNRMLHSLTC